MEDVRKLLFVIILWIGCQSSLICGFHPSSNISCRRERLCCEAKQIDENENRPQRKSFEISDDPSMTRGAFFGSAIALLSTPMVVSASMVENNYDVRSNNNINDNNNITLTASSSSEAAPNESSLQESISGFVAGASLSCTKTLVKYPLDTATVRLQIPSSDFTIFDPIRLFNGCYNGITLTLLGNIPAGAVFFAVKDATKSGLKNSGLDLPRWLTTSLAVAAAQVPYWLVRNPSEVIKVRQQANIEGYEGVSAIDAVKQILQGDPKTKNVTFTEGISDLFTGYWENILYAYPADVIKFVAYEGITKGRKDLSPVEGAQAGALATALAQFVTTPLDVVRNRLMTGKDGNGQSLSAEEKSKGYIESLVSLGNNEGVDGLFAGASPRVGKALLSGAIQFATYEETKQSISKLLQQKIVTSR
jgi:solute carrier family 25 S-adenosylmethionine transporter 26